MPLRLRLDLLMVRSKVNGSAVEDVEGVVYVVKKAGFFQIINRVRCGKLYDEFEAIERKNRIYK